MSPSNYNNNPSPDFEAQGLAQAVADIADTTPAPAAERRVAAGAGLVRLSSRDATLLAQMRNQYRKVFGLYFDVVEFTGNDLYARATLLQCIGSGNGGLATMALHFLDREGKPRLHRRLGHADVEIESMPDKPAS